MAELFAVFLASGALWPQARAELKPPSVGDLMRWRCSGPYTTSYAAVVTRNKGDLVRYEMTTDNSRYWIEQSSRFIGTTLWNHKAGDETQWFHDDEFNGFEELSPGRRFRGAVAAQKGASTWVWDYDVSIGEPKQLDQPPLGPLTVSVVVEQRKIYFGQYCSRMTSYVVPDRGLTVRWTYEDPAGVEHCDLSDYERRAAG